jgi:RNA polymerase sigma factor (sigma-70 family)
MSEKQLLERFIYESDQDAFKALIERHGAMVLGVCRGVLRDSHDVEDAFQTTFLTLAKSANTIKNRDYIGPWLHRVALRVAKNVRAKALASRCRERDKALFGAESASENCNRDLLPLLHEEMGRLPERYRLPLVLCYFEGKSTEEAAMQLQCPVGTVKGRLSRARERLRDRFSRRGLRPEHGTWRTPD